MPIHFRTTPATQPFTFDSVGNHWAQPPIHRPDGYPFYHYLQTEQGEGALSIQGHTYRLPAGAGILIPPFVRHAYAGTGGDWVTAFATFTGTLSSSLSHLLGPHHLRLIDPKSGGPIQAEIDDLMAHWAEVSAQPEALSLCCYRLLLHLTRPADARQPGEEPLYDQYVAPVIREIETRYAQPLTVEALSRTVFITPQYLCRLFRRFVGCSVHAYLTHYRISRARELLLSHPRAEVGQIAEQVGFADASHFIYMFKKITGVTPLAFRRLN